MRTGTLKVQLLRFAIYTAVALGVSYVLIPHWGIRRGSATELHDKIRNAIVFIGGYVLAWAGENVIGYFHSRLRAPKS